MLQSHGDRNAWAERFSRHGTEDFDPPNSLHPQEATRNKCIASSNKCLTNSSNKKLL